MTKSALLFSVVTALIQSHTFKFFKVEKRSVRLRGSGMSGEHFNVKVDGSTVRLAAVATPSMADACVFCRLDFEVWKPTMSFLRSP